MNSPRANNRNVSRAWNRRCPLGPGPTIQNSEGRRTRALLLFSGAHETGGPTRGGCPDLCLPGSGRCCVLTGQVLHPTGGTVFDG